MDKISSIAVLGTYDTKGEEHLFLKERVEKQGLRAFMINVGTKKPASCDVDLDLFTSLHDRGVLSEGRDRDEMIQTMLQEAGDAVKTLYDQGEICGIVSAGGGSGTHLCTGIMRVLPLGVPSHAVYRGFQRHVKRGGNQGYYHDAQCFRYIGHQQYFGWYAG